ncbi:hypothetical protein ACWGH5_27660 [Streptomyces sp. NPDC054864]
MEGEEAVRVARVAAAFAEIDAAIAQAEAEADELDWPPPGQVSPEEVAVVQAEIEAARTLSAAAARRGERG